MENQSRNAIVPAENRKKILDLVQSDKFRTQLGAALMSRVPEEYVLRAALACINADAKLQICDPVTVAASILQLAQAGLAPEPWKGHGYLIPRRNWKKGNRYECTALIGYRGFLFLSYKSTKVVRAEARPVYAGDFFDCDLGSGMAPVHKPWMKPTQDSPTRGDLIAAYATVKLDSGEHLVELMLREDIEAIRDRSESVKKKKQQEEKDDRPSGPWDTDFSEMARKTPFRRLFKWVPDAELQRIAALDEATELGKAVASMDADTGEITIDVDHSEPEHSQEPEMQAPQRKSEAEKQEQPKPTVADAFGPRKAERGSFYKKCPGCQADIDTEREWLEHRCPEEETKAEPKPEPQPEAKSEPKSQAKALCPYEDEYGTCVLEEWHDGAHVTAALGEPKYIDVISDDQRRKLFAAMVKAKPKSKDAKAWEAENKKYLKEQGFSSTAEITVDKFDAILAHFEKK